MSRPVAENRRIHDVFVKSIERVESDGTVRWPIIRYQDHLLRRFGQADVVRALPGEIGRLRLRQVADEVWALIDGRVEFVWVDLREGSPTRGERDRLRCMEPTLVLAPFGVAFGYQALEAPALLLRLATHADGQHPADRFLDWETTP